jgi:S-adenosyl methyltransferase
VMSGERLFACKSGCWPGSPGVGAARVAGIYDALLGGTDNRAADREAARHLDEAVPGAVQAARDNRAFLSRATEFLAGRAGISQFLDIGAGPLTGTSVHKMAQAACPGAAAAYVDNDPLVVEDAQRRLAGASRPVIAVEGDVRYPADMLAMREIRNVIDFSRPVAVLLVAVLHFVSFTDRRLLVMCADLGFHVACMFATWS